MARLTREKAEQLRTLSSQLLLFESRLCRKQKEIEASLAQRESIILRQQRVIRQLQSRLAERSTGTRDSPPCDALDRLDSLGDSDSAVVLEEAADDLAPPRYAYASFNRETREFSLRVFQTIATSVYYLPAKVKIDRITCFYAMIRITWICFVRFDRRAISAYVRNGTFESLRVNIKYRSQVSLEHHRRDGDPIGFGRGRTVEQVLVDATMQRFPEETGDLGDRLLGGGGRRQRKQSGPVRIDGKLGMRGETGKELGKRKGQTSGFVRQLRETRSRGRLPAQRETKGRKSAGAGKKIFLSEYPFSHNRLFYRATSWNVRVRELSSPLRILFPTFHPLRFVYLSYLLTFFTIFAVFSESFEIKGWCNRVYRTLVSQSQFWISSFSRSRTTG